jgi:hypothetical protein
MTAVVRDRLLPALAVVAALLFAGPAGAAAPPGYKVRAIGDSVTSGFGYCGSGDTVCDGPQDSVMSILRLIPCISGPLDDSCSSNFGNPTGIGSRVSWALQFARGEGVQDFDNFAVQGSTPADWDTGGQLNGQLSRVVAANPNLTLMTLGANPILGEFAHGGALACILFGTNMQVQQCASQLLSQNQTTAHLENVYATLLSGSSTHVVVFRYHNPIPLLAAALSLRPKVAIVLRQIDQAVSHAVTATQARFPGRITMLAPAFSPWGLNHQCTVVQALLVLEWLDSHGQQGLAPSATSTPWVLSGDSCIHPTIAGYQQFVAPLVTWFGSGGSGQLPTLTAPRVPLLRVIYKAVQIGRAHPQIKLVLGKAARVIISVGADRCLQREITNPQACNHGSNRIHSPKVISRQLRAGSHSLTLPLGTGYYSVGVTATASGGEREGEALELVDQSKSGLLAPLHGAKPR